MGIHGLAKLIADHAPGAIKEQDIKNYFGNSNITPFSTFKSSKYLCSRGLTFQFLFIFQFIDLCILLGCDYCGTIKGIGPKRAIDLIRQHGSIEEILENIDPNVS
ncbi:Elongation of fatty acids protein 2 [Goodea atripinnis]|uniref:Elongation of fatty acids protein 2 n=1 Tax=Goodea atripinnis TaxID=208336 RepID=A0ABV0NPX2_9TELE